MRLPSICDGNKFFQSCFFPPWLPQFPIKRHPFAGTKVFRRHHYDLIEANRAFFAVTSTPSGDFDLIFGAAQAQSSIRDIPHPVTRSRVYGEPSIDPLARRLAPHPHELVRRAEAEVFLREKLIKEGRTLSTRLSSSQASVPVALRACPASSHLLAKLATGGLRGGRSLGMVPSLRALAQKLRAVWMVAVSFLIFLCKSPGGAPAVVPSSCEAGYRVS